MEAPLLVLDLQPGAQVVLVERHERDASACSHAVVQNLQKVHVRLAKAPCCAICASSPGAQDDKIAHHLHLRLGGRALSALALAAGAAYHLQRR